MNTRRRILSWFVCLVAGLAGCAHRSQPAPMTPLQLTGIAALTLDQITPFPRLPATRPAAEADGAAAEAPPEALDLFARARLDLSAGRRSKAITELGSAVQIDPDSYELRYAYGKALRGGVGFDARAAEQFERAAELQPDRIDVQLDLGRQWLAKGDAVAALARFRLAIQTSEYNAGDVRNAEADFLLAHALRELGYERAATDRLELLAGRFERGEVPADDDTGPVSMATRLYVQLGDLYFHQQRAADALAAYRKAEAAPGGSDDIDVAGRLVRALLASGKVEDALRLAIDAVRRVGGGAAVTLLRETFRTVGQPEGAAQAMVELHRRQPDDQGILFSLCDVLTADGRAAEAQRLLEDAWNRSPGDVALLLRRFTSRIDAGDASGAVRTLINALAAQPALAGQIEPAWERLLSPEGRQAISPLEIARLEVPAGSQAARGYVAWKIATGWPRASVARAALDDAVAARPVFAPAFRAKLAITLADGSSPQSTRLRAAESLADDARRAGEAALAAELSGRIALFQNDSALAVADFTEAVRGQPAVPEARLGLAEALRAYGEEAGFASQCAKLLEQFPAFDDAYAALCDQLLARFEPSRADEVLEAWDTAQPWRQTNLRLLVLRGRAHLATGHPEAAELVLSEADRLSPADPAVLDLAYTIYQQTGRIDRFAARLEQRLGDVRQIGTIGISAIATRLARLYVEQSRPADAVRVLDFASAAVGVEPDLLAAIAEVYLQAGATDAAKMAAQRAVTIDPACAAASAVIARVQSGAGS